MEIDIRLRMLESSVIPDQMASTTIHGSVATQPMNSFTRRPFSAPSHPSRNDLISIADGIPTQQIQVQPSYSVLTRDSMATTGHLTALAR